MNKLVHISISYFLATLMIVFTAGVPVFEHYCSCSNQKISSFFVEVTCAETGEASCCDNSEDKSSCCSTPKECCGEASQCEIEGCCQTNSEVIKIDSEYQVSVHKTGIDGILFFITIAFAEVLNSGNEPITVEPIFTDPSPPLFGRQLLTAIQQLKIAIPAC